MIGDFGRFERPIDHVRGLILPLLFTTGGSLAIVAREDDVERFIRPSPANPQGRAAGLPVFGNIEEAKAYLAQRADALSNRRSDRSSMGWRAVPSLRVADLEASAKFYREMLGFDSQYFLGPPPSVCEVRRRGVTVLLTLSDVHPALTTPGAGQPARDWPDVFFWIDDLEAFYEECKSKNVTFARPLGERDFAGRAFDVIDCDGYLLRFGSRDDPLTGQAG